jgi:hypothetical protein
MRRIATVRRFLDAQWGFGGIAASTSLPGCKERVVTA